MQHPRGTSLTRNARPHKSPPLQGYLAHKKRSSTVQVDDLGALALAAGVDPVAVQAIKNRRLY